MGSGDFDSINQKLWNRKFLNSFWFSILIAAVTEELNFIAAGYNLWEMQLFYMVLPTGINAAIMGLSELVYRRVTWGFHYMILAVATVMCSVVITIHYVVDYIMCLLFLPIMISAFYYKKSLVLYTSGLCIMSFLLLTYFHPMLRERTGPVEWISMPAILVVATLIALSVMQRGTELLNELRNESQDKQNLMIQNVIKDKMVRTDTLTGLYNRAALFEHLEMLLRYTEIEGFSMHVAMMDIDHFKSVNDTFGHHIGDVVLKRVSALIRDGIGTGDFAARYGGEEFTAVFTDRTLQEVTEALEKIRKSAESLEHPELEGRSVTISIGLHPYVKGMDKETLIGQADACLYQAKRTGRNKIVSS